MEVGIKRDRALMLCVFFALCIEVVYLSHTMKWAPIPGIEFQSDSSGVEIGRLVQKQGSLRRRSLGSLSWYPMGTKEAVHLRDTVFSGANSQGIVKFGDGGSITLEPNTLIRFTQKTDTANSSGLVELELVRGNVKIKQARPLRVRVGNKTVRLDENSVIQLEKESLSTLAKVDVTEGRVQIEQISDSPTEIGTEAQNLVAGQSIVLAAERDIAEISPPPLAFEPQTPSNNAKLTSDESLIKLDLSWLGESDADVVISNNPTFQPSKRLKETEPKEIRLLPGKYYWRLEKADRLSSTATFTVMPPLKYEFLEPKNNGRVRSHSQIKLRWKPVERSIGYKIQVSRSDSFDDLLVDEWTESNELVREFEPGTYFWRIQAEHEQYGAWEVSPTQRLRAAPPLKAPKPTGVKILPSESRVAPKWQKWMELIIPSAHAEDLDAKKKIQLKFEWETVPGAVGYQLEVSDSKNFRNKLVQKETPATNQTLELPNRSAYFWRVRAKDEWGDYSPPSAIQKLVVEKRKPVISKKKKVPQAKQAAKPTPLRATHLRNSLLTLEYASGYENTRLRGTNFNVSTSGFALHRYSANFDVPFGDRVLTLRGSYQRYLYKNSLAYLSEFQPTVSQEHYRINLLMGAAKLVPGKLSWAGGIAAERKPIFRRAALEQAIAEGTYSGSFQFGVRYWSPFTKKSSLESELLLSLAPLGQLRGLSLIWQTRYILEILPKFVVVPFLRIDPSYEILSPENSKTLNLRAYLGLSAGYKIGD